MAKKRVHPASHHGEDPKRREDISVRLMLMLGRFDYTERGILDRTHLRFFTRRTIRDLLEGENCSILRHRMTVIPLEVLFSLSLENPLMRVMHETLILLTRMMPGLLGYQSFLTARLRKSYPMHTSP